jgi:2'-hydroxyisoflavone reductase
MAERNEIGIYNALGPSQSMSMCEMLGGIRGVVGTSMRLHWVSVPWIADRELISAETLEWKIWRYFAADSAINSDKACSKGLVFRPLSITTQDTLAWYKSLPFERQETILNGAKKGDDGKWKAVSTRWSEIIEQEKQIITRWEAHKARIT